VLLSLVWVDLTRAADTPTSADTQKTVSALTDVQWRDGECPVCGKKVSLALVSPVGVNAGVDHDLFARSLGPQPEFYLINTCPNCHFSGYLGDFDLILPNALKETIKKQVQPAEPISPEATPREIDTLEKYDLAWQTFDLLERSDEAMGWLALRASWVARDLYCNLPRHPKLKAVLQVAGKAVPVVEGKENPADREIEQAKQLEETLAIKSFSAAEAWSYEAVIGLLYRRHGENVRALPHIERVIGNEASPKEVREAFLRMRRSIDEEACWQSRAAARFERAISAGAICPENQPTAKYLVGQLYLRLGQKDKAKHWFRESLKEPKLPPRLAEWIKTDFGMVK
jgi:tetratricopeptide (TPR) repeat protein